MPPLSIENLPSNPNILPPLIVKKRGRLRRKRVQKGALKRKQIKCTNCLQLGHNKRRCVAQLARNGRVERAHDWDISSSESNSELERELAPFIEQARAKTKAKAEAIVAVRVAVRAVARATVRARVGDNESKLSDLQSSNIELIAPLSLVLTSLASLVLLVLLVLQLRPKRAWKVPARY
jgi:hypothetical protein